MMESSALLNKNKRLKLDDESSTVRDSIDDLSIEKKDVHGSKVATANDASAGVDSLESNNRGSRSSSLTTLSAWEKSLQNPVILHHLFQLSPVSILASCRLVCKQWYDESLITWRTSFPLSIRNNGVALFLLQNYHSHFGINQGLDSSLKEFLEFNDNPENQCVSKPYRNVTIDGWKFSFCSAEFEVFWKSIGINLTTLKLYKCIFISIEEFRQIIYKSCPLLQKLNIIECEFCFETQSVSVRDAEYGVAYKEPLHGIHKLLKTLTMELEIKEIWGQNEQLIFPVSWIELFSHFPSLTSFECAVSSCHRYIKFPVPELESLFEAIETIRRRDDTKLPFTHFQIRPCFEISRDSASHLRFDLVRKLRLPLKDCSLRAHHELGKQYVTSTLQYIAPSLNTIKLLLEDEDIRDGRQRYYDFSDTCSRIISNFPFGITLDNLTRLDFPGDKLENLRFLKYTPNLCELIISDREMDDLWSEGDGSYINLTDLVSNTCKEEFDNLKMAQLTTLHLGFGLWDRNGIQYLFKWMPNITKLEMVLDDEQFGMACQAWRNLRVLRVLGDEDNSWLTEAGVTGIDCQHCIFRRRFLKSLRGRLPYNKKNLMPYPDIYGYVCVCQKWENIVQIIKEHEAKYSHWLKDVYDYGITIRNSLRIANLESLESLTFDVVYLSPESVYHLFLHLPKLQILDHVHRGDLAHLDMSTYQRAVLRCSYYAEHFGIKPLHTLFYNVVEQWIAENSNGGEEKRSDSG